MLRFCWAEAAGLTPADEPRRWTEFPYSVYVRVLLAQNRPQEARALLTTMERSAKQGERRRNLITIYLQQALVYAHLGDYAGARTCFEQALHIGRELGAQPVEGEALGNLGFVCALQGEDQAASEYERQALHIAQGIGEPRLQAYALSRLGRALTGLGHLMEATEAYQQALSLRQEMGEHHLALESLAGLAHVSLAQGDIVQSQAYVEEILSHLENKTLDGADEPFRVYLTCYYVLHATKDPRAREILDGAYHLLEERANKIDDQELRRSFLENVATHRKIVKEFERLHEHDDRH